MTYFTDLYQKFRANPRNGEVADNLSYIYVPSTTTFEGKDAVINHLSRQSAAVKKNKEEVINTIESSDALILDIATTLEFVESGGAYLPHLDDNFLADRVVTFPTLHIVQFNPQKEIQQVRIYWDQGSLLKEVEVIGARARNWPIREAKTQIRLLQNAVELRSAAPSDQSYTPAQARAARPGSPGKRHIKDPHAADSLYDLLSPSKVDALRDDTTSSASPAKRYTKDPYAQESLTDILSPSKEGPPKNVRPFAPASAQPAPREYGDLFVETEAMPDSPSKPEKKISHKLGAGKYQANRIFNDENEQTPVKVERALYQPNPKKWDHFEIGDNNEAEPIPAERSMYKTSANKWNHFEIGDTDPATPKKSALTVPSAPVHGDHLPFEDGDVKTPHFTKHVNKPRRDAAIHFNLKDDQEEDGRIISSFQNRGKQLYQNSLFNETSPNKDSQKEHGSNRMKDFDSHFDMHDVSPVPPNGIENKKPIPAHQKSSWDNYDEASPEPIRPSTTLHNPGRHNQPSWSMVDEE
ncbi:hypothetical protein N7495_004692 [Penicillium taxi]|uniref:uncharacterized protein n=1 Tax=Penicillium taxi TaxID=168475 RepID=UPI0025452D16|nr:uncharacterized protein N7495_004692 [Penicillium taxi]KAJ5899948.1 hypothetical protein N7495_004692 [Penicillium taxi]